MSGPYIIKPPHKWRHIVPPSGAQVNLANPLSANLVYAALLGQPGYPVNLLRTGYGPTSTYNTNSGGSISHSTGAWGAEKLWSGNANYEPVNPSAFNIERTEKFTLLTLITVNSARSTQGAEHSLFATFNEDDGTYRGIGLGLQYSTTVSKNRIVQYLSNTFTSNDASQYGNDDVSNGPHILAWTYDGSSLNSGSLSYIDGVPQSGYTAINSDNLSATIVPSGVPVTIGGRHTTAGTWYQSWLGGITATYLWRGRVLTPSEISSLVANPYQILYVPNYRRSIFSIPVVSSLSTNVFDSITLTDSVTVSMYLPVSVSDDITLTDNVTVQEYLPVNVFDSITLTDNVTVNILLSISVSDSITLTDSVTVSLYLPVNVFDSITLIDNVTVLFYLPVNVFDFITLTDFVLVTTNPLYVNVFDSITLTDNVTVSLLLSINVFDSITLTDSVTVSMYLSVNVFDSVTLSESVTVSMYLLVNVFDSITLTDNVVVSFGNIIISVTDDITLTDNVTVTTNPLYINVFDSISLTDNVTVNLLLSINVNDSITLTDNVTVAMYLPVNVFDSITLIDTPFITINPLFISVNDIFSLSELIAITFSAGGVIVHDNITLSEFVNVVGPTAIQTGNRGTRQMLLREKLRWEARMLQEEEELLLYLLDD